MFPSTRMVSLSAIHPNPCGPSATPIRINPTILGTCNRLQTKGVMNITPITKANIANEEVI